MFFYLLYDKIHLESKDFSSAKHRHIELMTNEWESNRDWLAGINTLILLAKRHL